MAMTRDMHKSRVFDLEHILTVQLRGKRRDTIMRGGEKGKGERKKGERERREKEKEKKVRERENGEEAAFLEPDRTLFVSPGSSHCFTLSGRCREMCVPS